jgi:hypothetical protein
MKVRHHWAIAALSVAVIGSTSLSHAAPVSGQGTWESTLQGRDLDGNLSTFEAYYDTTLDITWLADANFAKTSGFDINDGVNDGKITWAAANTWTDSLTLGGYTDWRLPTNTPINGTSYNTAFSNNATTDNGTADADGWVDGSGNPVSEMGHLFYVTLGNLGVCTPDDANPGLCVNPPSFGLTNTGPFSNAQSFNYWSGSEFDAGIAWNLNFASGRQRNDLSKNQSLLAWAVRSGDVSAVPVPAAVWLFGSGLLGLMGVMRRQR